MTKKAAFLFFALIIMAPVVSSAQLGNFIRNKASKMINNTTKEKAREANSQIDSVARQRAEGIENDTAKAKPSQEQSPQVGMDFSQLFGSKVDLKYNEVYGFTSRLYMVTETYSKKEVMKIDLYMYFSSNTPSVGMETKSFSDEQGKTVPIGSSMVMDGENKCFIILTDLNGTKMGMISAIPDEKTDGEPVRKDYATDFHKTGNTRVIAGYTCDEFAYSNPESKTTGKLWFTKDANLKIDKRGWQKTGMSDYYGYSGFEGGVILGMEGYDEKGKLTMKTETKEINPNFDHSISVKGFTLRQMNLNQGKKKK